MSTFLPAALRHMTEEEDVPWAPWGARDTHGPAPPGGGFEFIGRGWTHAKGQPKLPEEPRTGLGIPGSSLLSASHVTL